MSKIYFIDRVTGKMEEEQVFGEKPLKFLYGSPFGRRLAFIISRTPFFSAAYGLLQKMPWTKKKIAPFIQKYDVDPSEFLAPVEAFSSFNDFFIRRLKPEARPLALGQDVAVMPADARYFFFQDISKIEGIFVKGQMFSLDHLLKDKALADRYRGGSMAIARLCPTDYHRFHFPFDCLPGNSRVINGYLYSVNPIALRQSIQIFSQNKRSICELATEDGSKTLFIEVGATNVGSIIQTYTPDQKVRKGAEKGYFSFGASSLILLFEPGRIRFDQDLIEAGKQGVEIRCLMGQQMGIITVP